MKFEKEINEIKTLDKVYLAFIYWDICLRRACPYTYKLTSASNAIDKIYECLPSICDLEIKHDDNYPYALVRVHM